MRKKFMPFSEGESELVSKGDIILLNSGEKFTFIEMKRTKWIGQNEKGKFYNIPVYLDKMGKSPFAKRKEGFNKDVIVKSSDPLNFSTGQIFSIESSKQTFIFKGIKKGKKDKIIGIDLVTGNTYKIDPECVFKKIDINKIKEENEIFKNI